MTADATTVRHRPKDRKRQILVHARDLFLQLGYPNVSMAMIAERVGITAGALYRHYATKADLLEAVVRDAFRGVVPPTGDLALEELIDREITAVADRPHLADLWSREVRHLSPEVRREIRAVMRQTARPTWRCCGRCSTAAPTRSGSTWTPPWRRRRTRRPRCGR